MLIYRSNNSMYGLRSIGLYYQKIATYDNYVTNIFDTTHCNKRIVVQANGKQTCIRIASLSQVMCFTS
ncbi:hypothetical protein AC070_00045 [Fannyhessea vaginae]|nr:hypothetical protein AC070_00045 [Fannyhessea vaginae]